MVVRMLLRFLANNEQLVQKLSDSYIMRRAAQMCVSAFYRTKTLAEQQGLKDLSPERFRSLMKSFQGNVKQEIESAKKEYQKYKK
ncbi:unnamed protein product [Diamesa serratosioi]